MTVELQGIYTRGMMVLDRDEKLKKEHKVFIMKNVDLEKFKEMLINAVKKSDAVHSEAWVLWFITTNKNFCVAVSQTMYNIH